MLEMLNLDKMIDGELHIQLRHKSGVMLVDYTQDNLIVNGINSVIAGHLKDDIVNFKVGDSVDAGTLPKKENTDIGNEVFSGTITSSSITSTDPYVIEFLIHIDFNEGQAAGETLLISEASLHIADMTMTSHARLKTVLPKNEESELNITWRYKFKN